MSKMQLKTFVTMGLFLVVLIRPGVAHAYVDPGTGTLFFQLILAAVAGSLFFFRNVRIKLMNFIRGFFSQIKE